MIRKGIIRGFDRVTYLATVELTGYQSTQVTSVPVAFHVRPDLLADGVSCAVLLFDPLNVRDGVLIAAWGGVPALDPLFDPVLGHRHQGRVNDGPRIHESDLQE